MYIALVRFNRYMYRFDKLIFHTELYIFNKKYEFYIWVIFSCAILFCIDRLYNMAVIFVQRKKY